ncbi:DUF2236 domain-containing protein, partial [Rhodococcus hoagii]|nr:DUF2236 domain-containing protein [Prescottella equi]
RPLDRLRTTMTYVYAVTLGTPEEKQACGAAGQQGARPVRSERYNAFDPELQLWVAATLYRNGSDMYRRFFGDSLTPTRSAVPTVRGVRDGAAGQGRHVPATRAEFDAYWDRMIESAEVDDQVRAYVRGLLSGGKAPLPVRLTMPLQRFFTIGLLPPPRCGTSSPCREPARSTAIRSAHDRPARRLPAGAATDTAGDSDVLPVDMPRPCGTPASDLIIAVAHGRCGVRVRRLAPARTRSVRRRRTPTCPCRS